MKLLFPARWALAAIFGYAGWQKLENVAAFADSIEAYRLLSPLFISLAALGLPIVELLAALMLIANRPRRLGALAAAAISFLFTLALASALARGLQIDCGCFGPPSQLPSSLWPAFGRAALLFSAALALYLFELLRSSPDLMANKPHGGS